MWKWIIVAAIGLFLAYIISSFLVTYRGMFTVKHYREVAAAVEKVRRGAMERLWVEGMDLDELAGPGDPRVLLTSRSLGISYTMTQQEDGFRHHISVSTPRAGHTTHAAGESFVSFFVWRMGLDPTDCESYFGPSAYHLEFTVPENAQPDFMEHSLSLPGEIELQTIRDEIAKVRERIVFVDATALLEEAGSSVS